MIDEGIKVPAVVVPTMSKVAARMELSVPALLEHCGLDESALEVSDEVIPFEVMNKFVEGMVEQSGIPTIGLYIGSYLGFDYLPGFEKFITSASTAREAIRALYFFEQFSPFYHFELREKPNLNEAHLMVTLFDECPESLKSVYVEMFFTIIDRYAKIILGERYKLKKLVLGFRLNGPLYEYKKVFNAPIEAGAIQNALILDLPVLDMALENALPQVNREAELEVRQMIKGALNKHGFKASVLAAMRENIELASGNVSHMADFMKMSVRGLQRKLKAEEATFSQLQLEARMNYAMEALENSEKSIEEISDELGFANRRSFSRAFGQYYGNSPSTYRKAVRKGDIGA